MGAVRNRIGYNRAMNTNVGAVLKGELLHYERADGPAVVLVGSPAWFDWLRRADRFVIEAPGGRITVRKERAGNKRGGGYWRALRKTRGRLRRFYLGADAELSPARLAQSVEALLAPEGQSPPRQEPNGSEHAAIVRTKLMPPQQRGQLVPRPALLALLQAGVAAPVTLVIAPPGFGKTTLLAQLVARLDNPSPPGASGRATVGGRRATTSWASLDSGDSEPARLVRTLAAALGRAEPGVADLAATATPEAAVAAMLNVVAGRSEPLVLILDDYHTLNAAAAHALVGELIARAPAGLHLVIAGREEPPLPLARLRAAGRLSELRAPELRFQGEETVALVQLISGRTLAPAEVAALEERTEGWAAGLQLAGLALRGQADPRAFTAAFAGTHRFVMDYLIEEVLIQQPPGLRRFLLETSVLERLSAPLCATLQGVQPGESQALLEEAERRGLFLVALDAERRWYRYHTLFAEVLRAELRREAGPERLDELRRAARWLSSRERGESGRQMAEQLTSRERVVLELIAEGATNAEIAERLYIAVSTVKAHINSMFGKLDARSRTQAVARARAQGLL